MRNSRTIGWLFASLAAIILQPAMFAQTASISGTVMDASKSAVPGATIKATNSATGATRTTESGDAGTFTLTSLPPGQYSVSVDKQAFTTVRFENVELTVAQALSLNPVLELAGITQTVDVISSQLAPIEMENAQLSNIVSRRRIVDLPLLTRNPYELVLLSPGVVQSNTDLGGFSVNGARERNNNFLLDGSDNNDTSVPGIPSGIIGLNPESTQEFRVITNNFLPEYGRNNGAIVEIITRSGTNQLHGDAYWFGRYAALAARDYFNTKPNPQDPFVRNEFGYSIGGPIKKDRTFFFLNNEFQRFRTTLTETSIVPTAAFKSGIFNFEGAKINLADPASPNNAQGLPLDPTVQKLLAVLPEPNGEMVDDIRGLYRFPSTSKQNAATLVFKVDHRFSDKYMGFIRYGYNGYSDPNAYHDEIIPGMGNTASEAQTHSIAASLTAAFSPSLVNDFRFGVNRNDNPYHCNGMGPLDQFSQLDPFGAAPDYYFSGMVTLGCATLGDSNGQTRRTGTWNLNDNLTLVKGRHTLKFGGEARFVFENGYSGFYSRPSLTFDAFTTFGVPVVNLDPANPCDPGTGAHCGSDPTQFQNLASSLLGLVDWQYQSQFFDKNGRRTAVDDRRFRQREYGVFVQDSFKMRPNLTLNVGLRYQLNGVPFETDNNLSNLFADPAGRAPFTFSLVGPGTGRSLYERDTRNFEPRVGLSWDPFQNGKTAIRAGYGIFHDRVFGNLIINARANPPFQQDIQNFPGDLLPNVPTPETATPSATVEDGARIAPVLFDPALKMPISQNWNFGIQQNLLSSLVLDVNYVGSKGWRELRVVNGNQPRPELINTLIANGISPRLLEGIGLYYRDDTTYNTALVQPSVNKSIGNSTYNGLQAKLTKRYGHGMEIQGSYTYSHSIDDASDPLVAAFGNRPFPRNSFDLRQERGNSDFDQRQRLIVNYIWELPFGRGKTYMRDGALGRIMEGWQFTGISLFEDGHPYDVFGNRDSEHTSVSTRADLIGNPGIPAGSARTQTGPPVSAFDLAPYGRAGNLGRNVFVGPGTVNTDLVLAKNQSITERMKMQLRFEFYNLFNRVQFAQPGNLIADPGTFGLSTATVSRPDGTSSARQIQLALKLSF
jgi:hypothetical protein